MRRRLLALVLAVMVLLPAAGQAGGGLVCQVRQHRTGPVCWCRVDRPGSRWQVYPMALCVLTR